MNEKKLQFLKNDAIALLENITDIKRKWGKMNAQQMVEHISDFFKVSTEKLKFPLITPAEHLPKYKEFLLSDKEFKENTLAPKNIVPEEPIPIRKASMNQALAELQSEVNDFINFFENNSEKKATHPVFGHLNFEEWVQLHYKHVMHHLKQFNLM